MVILGAGAAALHPSAAAPALQDGLDADHVYGPLWIGSAPPLGTALREAGFDVVVLCSGYQPRSAELPGVFVVHAPFGDRDPATREDVSMAQSAAMQVAQIVRSNPNVRILVTCMAGINRSALVTALALHLLYGWDARQSEHVVRAHRPGALSNQDFRRYLEWVAPSRR